MPRLDLARLLSKEHSDDAHAGLLCLPALVILLATGLLLGRSDGALVATSGAFSVGFGSFQRFTRHKAAPMVLAALGMTLSAALGSVLGLYRPALLIACALWAGACAWALKLGQGAWWIGLQWTIALLVAGAYPAGPQGALVRASLVLGGGVLQLAIVTALWRAQSRNRPAHHVQLRAYLRLARIKASRSEVTTAYAQRAAAAAVLSMTLAEMIHMPNRYWAPMTALLVLRPTLEETFSRGVSRGAGTVIGAGLASLAAAILRPGVELTALLVVIFAWGSYATRRIHYAALTTSVTAFIVFLLALGGLPEVVNAAHRIAATVLGGCVALVLALVAPKTPPAPGAGAHGSAAADSWSASQP